MIILVPWLCDSAPTGESPSAFFMSLSLRLFLVNLTSAASDLLPQIICPDIAGQPQGQRTLIRQAISDNVRNTYLAGESSRLGTTSPAFKAIFKSDANKYFVTSLFTKLSTIPDAGSRGRPRFICIRSQEEAQQYGTWSLQLWQQCTAGAGTHGLPFGSTYFLCPRFFTLSDDVQVARPQLCPAVQANLFADNPQRSSFIPTKAVVFTGFLIHFYASITTRIVPGQSYISWLNSIVGWDARRAGGERISYLVFTDCKMHPKLHFS